VHAMSQINKHVYFMNYYRRYHGHS